MTFEYYNTLSATDKFRFRENNYCSMFLSMLCNMFDIEGLKKSEVNFLMATLYTHGTCLIERQEDNTYVLCAGDFEGVPKPNKIYPSNYIAVKAGYEFRADVDEAENATVVYMNQFLSPCQELIWYCEQFADIDTSLVNNIKYARIAPIACVQDDVTKTAYEECVKRMLNGELINSLMTYLNINNNEPAELSMIDISQGQYADKIQYLSAYHEQLLSRFFKMFGISYNYISKQANITEKELDNTDDFASMLPLYIKDCINEGLEKIGLKAEFSKTWKWIDRIDVMKASDQGITEESEEQEDKKEGEENATDEGSN